MSKYFDILKSLPTVDKVELLKELYKDISGKGIGGDTELAHINNFEAAVLRALGGAGTIHEETGLHQYMGGGSPPPPPAASQTVTQQATIPAELSPYIKDILAKAQALQEQRMKEGYQPYQGQQIAGFTPEQQQAFQGISGLVGTGAQYYDPAARLAAASARTTTPEMVGQYMSPYMQNVLDIQKREAERAGDVERQRLGARAVGAGGYGGSRQAILEAEQARNLNQQLGDIQARGLAASYEDAQRRIAEQRARELGAGQFFGQLGQAAPQTALTELGALAGVGGQRQQQYQSALDIARGQYEAEKLFPEQQLQQYSSIVRGFPLPASSQTNTSTITPAPSYLQQFAGLGTTALGAYGAFGGFKAKGGKVGDGKGLASIVVKRADGGSVGLFGDRFKEMQRASRPAYTGPTFPLPPEKPEYEAEQPQLVKPTPVPKYTPPTFGRQPEKPALPEVSKEDAVVQAAQETAASNPKAAEKVSNFGDDILGRLSEITKAKKEAVSDREKNLEQSKWLSLADLGFSILAQPGGQTFLEAVGKGGQQSNITGKLAALSDKQKELAASLPDLDRQEIMDTFNISKAKMDQIDKERELALKEKQVSGTLDLEAKKLGITEQHYKDLAAKYGEDTATKLLIAELQARSHIQAASIAAGSRGKMTESNRKAYIDKINLAAKDLDTGTLSLFMTVDDPIVSQYALNAHNLITNKTDQTSRGGPASREELAKTVPIKQIK